MCNCNRSRTNIVVKTAQRSSQSVFFSPPKVLYEIYGIHVDLCVPCFAGIRSPVWQYPVITPTPISHSSHVESSRSNSVTQSSDSMSNGSATPPTAEHPPQQQQQQQQQHHLTLLHNGGGVSDTAKFVFPQSAIPLSPSIFSNPSFFGACASSGVTPMTPTLIGPSASIEPYLRAPGQVYSPFTLAPPIPSSLPKTPTLPPPSPHTIVGGAFPITSQGLPTSANMVNPSFGKGYFLDEIAKIGGNFPFTVVSSGGNSPKRANGTPTVFFPTTITANGDAKLTIMNGSFGQGHDGLGMDDPSRGSATNSPIVKIEPNTHPASCCVGDDV